MADVLGFLKKALPWIGSAAAAVATGGPVGLLSVAAKGIGQIIGKDVTPSADSIAAAVAGATPDQLIQMRKLDDDFQVQMKQLGFQHEEELEALGVQDRASARVMQVQTRSWVVPFLAIGITLGFFSLLFLLLKYPPPSASAQVMDIMLGALATAWIAVVTYYFGSSAGSDRKTELMAQNSPK